MTFIPVFRFIASLIIFGLLFYAYNPIVEFLQTDYPVVGIYATAMFFLWIILPGVNVFGQGIRMVMAMQRKV